MIKNKMVSFAIFIISLTAADIRAQDANVNAAPVGLTEKFLIKGCEDADLVALAVPKGGFFQSFPRDVKVLDEPQLANVQGVFTKLRNGSNEVVGFASELEVLGTDEVGLFSKTDWTLKIPGRGSLFATQLERFNKLIVEIEEAKRRGEKEKFFNPPLYIITTVPGTGSLIGGTGEFSGATGLFREINEFRYISLSGHLCVDITLEATFFKDKQINKQGGY